MKRILAIAALISATAAGATACAPKHSTPARNVPTISASSKAQAQREFKALTKKCLPADALGQVRLAKSLKSSSGRAKLAAKCGIPPKNREAAESKILAAAVHGHLTTKSGRVQFFTVTLPKIIESEQA